MNAVPGSAAAAASRRLAQGRWSVTTARAPYSCDALSDAISAHACGLPEASPDLALDRGSLAWSCPSLAPQRLDRRCLLRGQALRGEHAARVVQPSPTLPRADLPRAPAEHCGPCRTARRARRGDRASRTDGQRLSRSALVADRSISPSGRPRGVDLVTVSRSGAAGPSAPRPAPPGRTPTVGAWPSGSRGTSTCE